MKKIAIATGTRADWGLLSPLARALTDHPAISSVEIIATNMHLLHRYGHTVDEIIADGFEVARRVEMEVEGDGEVSNVRRMARCMEGMARALDELRPDLLVILGDRFEMLATASAALMMHIPIVHIAGGAISEGAVDDSIRHAITKMASLHLVETEEYRRRVIAMGEEPARVVHTGAIGVASIGRFTPLSAEELSQSVGIPIGRSTLLVTYHPATLDDADTATRFATLLEALDRFPDNPVLFTYPNNDARGAVIIDMIHRWVEGRPAGTAAVVPSLGHKRYMSALHHVGAVVGNSSSGIVEVPSMHIPTVDIGIRQRGRTAASSVIHVADDASPDAIAQGIALALSPRGRQMAREAVNPYYRPDTVKLMVDTIVGADPASLRIKRFYDYAP